MCLRGGSRNHLLRVHQISLTAVLVEPIPWINSPVTVAVTSLFPHCCAIDPGRLGCVLADSACFGNTTVIIFVIPTTYCGKLTKHERKLPLRLSRLRKGAAASRKPTWVWQAGLSPSELLQAFGATNYSATSLIHRGAKVLTHLEIDSRYSYR
jgi:hypothetical protein